MSSLRGLLRLALIGTVLIWALAFSAGRADSAIGLQCTAGGQAVWFYRSCRDSETHDVAGWSVGLDPRSQMQSLLAAMTNAYPGYRLQCELHLANTGQMPLSIGSVSVGNTNPLALSVSAAPAGGDSGRVLQPCRRAPAWGTSPSQVAANCQATINLSILVGQSALQGHSYGYGVLVNMKEAVGGRP